MRPAVIFLLCILLSFQAYGLELSSPVDGAVSEVATPELTWDDPSNMTLSYEILVSSDRNFSHADYNYTSLIEKYVVSDPWPDGVWYWKVRPISLNSTDNYTEPWEYTVNTSVDISGLIFDLSTESASLYKDEPFRIVLDAPEGASAELLVQGPGLSDTYSTDVEGHAEIMYVPTAAGDYTVSVEFSYLGQTVEREIQISVAERAPLSCEVLGPSSVMLEDMAVFYARLSNAEGDMTYSWKVDGKEVSSDPSVETSFGSEGDHNIALSISDRYSDASCEMDVDVTTNYFDIIVKVRDNENKPVPRAKVEIDGIRKSVNSEGETVYKLVEGEYDLNVTKDGYFDTSVKLAVDKDKTVTVELKGEDEAPPPQIKILAPPDEVELNFDYLTVRFEAKADVDILSCKVLFNPEDIAGWKVSDSLMNPNQGENTIRIEDLFEGRYRFKVRCEDKNRKTAESDTRHFIVPDLGTNNVPSVVSRSVPVEEENVQEAGFMDDIITRFQDIKEELLSYSDRRKVLLERLDVPALLSETEAKLLALEDNYQTYLDSNLEPDALELKEEQIRTKAKGLMDKLPSSVDIESTSTFIYYPEKDKVRAVASRYMELNQIELSDRSFDRYMEEVFSFQSSFDIAVKLSVMTISYEGTKKSYTVVEKSLPEADYADRVLVESIPKEIAGSYEDMIVLSSHMVLDEDPVLQFSISKPEAVYMVPGKHDSVVISRIGSGILLRKFRATNSITGLSVAGLKKVKPSVIFLEVFLMVLLAGGATIGYRSYKEKEGGAAKTEKELISGLTEIFDLLGSGKKMEAFSRCDRVLDLYALIPEERRQMFREMMDFVRAEIDEHYFLSEIRKLETHVDAGEREKASQLLRNCVKLMDELPDEKRSEHSHRLDRLGSIMNEPEKTRDKVLLDDGTEVTIEDANINH